MGFTVQLIKRDNSGTKGDQWAVLLDHEHVMFVGSYRQCEDWLDLHEITIPKSDAATERVGADGQTGWCQQIKWFLDRLATWSTPREPGRSPRRQAVGSETMRGSNASNSRSSTSRTTTFLRSDAGHCSTNDLILASIFVGTVYFGTMFLTLDAAWKTVSAYRPLIQTTRSSLSARQGDEPSRSVCYCGTLDIACDLASSE